MTNADSAPRDREVQESAGPQAAPRRTSRPTLAYYTPPPHPPRPGARIRSPRRAAADRPRGTRIDEGATPELAGDSAFDDEILPDVGVASFGNATPRGPLLVEAIIGTDDRTRVDPQLMGQNPWRQICALRITSSRGRRYVGTGWYIGPRTVATAGHCVYLQDDGGWASEIIVIPAKAGPTEPYQELSAKRFASVDGWVKQRSRDFDYGIIELDDGDVGARIGNFAVDALPPDALRAAEAQISGYPADRDGASYQYFHMRPLIDVTDTRLVYDIDTFGGQSGSPVWQDTVEGGIVAIGIHTNGGVTSNSGTRITQDVLGNLAHWATEGLQ